jgi:hypothetical protein
LGIFNQYRDLADWPRSFTESEKAEVAQFFFRHLLKVVELAGIQRPVNIKCKLLGVVSELGDGLGSWIVWVQPAESRGQDILAESQRAALSILESAPAIRE